MKDPGKIVPVDVRRLPRSIMWHVMGHDRRPDRPRRSLRLDHQAQVPTDRRSPGSPEARNGVAAASLTASLAYRRAAVQAKLSGFEDRFRITSDEVNPAYTSQTCWCCGYFKCLWCGNTMHADVNAARMSRQTRAPDLVLTTSTRSCPSSTDLRVGSCFV